MTTNETDYAQAFAAGGLALPPGIQVNCQSLDLAMGSPDKTSPRRGLPRHFCSLKSPIKPER